MHTVALSSSSPQPDYRPPGFPIRSLTQKAPKGKLRLLYEANPLALIVEQADGMATDGSARILDLKPTELHQRMPLYIGSKAMVEKAMKG